LNKRQTDIGVFVTMELSQCVTTGCLISHDREDLNAAKNILSSRVKNDQRTIQENQQQQQQQQKNIEDDDCNAEYPIDHWLHIVVASFHFILHMFHLGNSNGQRNTQTTHFSLFPTV
jgi:hypothetical protein